MIASQKISVKFWGFYRSLYFYTKPSQGLDFIFFLLVFIYNFVVARLEESLRLTEYKNALSLITVLQSLKFTNHHHNTIVFVQTHTSSSWTVSSFSDWVCSSDKTFHAKDSFSSSCELQSAIMVEGLHHRRWTLLVDWFMNPFYFGYQYVWQ